MCALSLRCFSKYSSSILRESADRLSHSACAPSSDATPAPAPPPCVLAQPLNAAVSGIFFLHASTSGLDTRLSCLEERVERLLARRARVRALCFRSPHTYVSRLFVSGTPAIGGCERKRKQARGAGTVPGREAGGIGWANGSCNRSTLSDPGNPGPRKG
jgi:hypothetical protein